MTAQPERLAREALAARLEVFDIPEAMPPWTLAMLWKPAARTDQATAWLRRCVQDAAPTA